MRAHAGESTHLHHQPLLRKGQAPRQQATRSVSVRGLKGAHRLAHQRLHRDRVQLRRCARLRRLGVRRLLEQRGQVVRCTGLRGPQRQRGLPAPHHHAQLTRHVRRLRPRHAAANVRARQGRGQRPFRSTQCAQRAAHGALHGILVAAQLRHARGAARRALGCRTLQAFRQRAQRVAMLAMHPLSRKQQREAQHAGVHGAHVRLAVLRLPCQLAQQRRHIVGAQHAEVHQLAQEGKLQLRGPRLAGSHVQTHPCDGRLRHRKARLIPHQQRGQCGVRGRAHGEALHAVEERVEHQIAKITNPRLQLAGCGLQAGRHRLIRDGAWVAHLEQHGQHRGQPGVHDHVLDATASAAMKARAKSKGGRWGIPGVMLGSALSARKFKL